MIRSWKHDTKYTFIHPEKRSVSYLKNIYIYARLRANNLIAHLTKRSKIILLT